MQFNVFQYVTEHESILQIENFLQRIDDDPALEQLLGNPFATPLGPTFPEFVEHILTSEKQDHWRPYTEHCLACALDYNMILK